MRGFLLDTNVVSEFRKRDRADEHVVGWLADHVRDEFWLSVLVVGELRRGVELLSRRDVTASATLTAWLDSVVDDYEDRILPVTLAVCERWARITVPDPLPTVDGLLAATAIEHDLVLATRNVTDVERTGVAFVNPFAPATNE